GRALGVDLRVQVVQDHDLVASRDQPVHDVRPDEPRAPRDEHSHDGSLRDGTPGAGPRRQFPAGRQPSSGSPLIITFTTWPGTSETSPATPTWTGSAMRMKFVTRCCAALMSSSCAPTRMIRPSYWRGRLPCVRTTTSIPFRGSSRSG